MKKRRLLHSFRNAFTGFFIIIKIERNLKIHLSAFALSCITGFFFSITKIEWLAILIISGVVISLEILNCSIEKLCDFIEPKDNEKIKIIKDIAAAAVLVTAIFAFIIGILIFSPYLKQVVVNY
jgi:diacylglycerol kinase